MDFETFRKQNKENLPPDMPDMSKVDVLQDPAGAFIDIDSKQGDPDGDEKKHQNQDLLKMKGGTAWLPRGPHVKTPGLSEGAKTHRKVKIHFGNGHSEVRMVDDDELGVLRKSNKITKVMDVHEGTEDTEQSWTHPDGRKATLQSWKYADPSLGTDHYVHLPDANTTSYSNEEGLGKAQRLLSKLGYAPAKE